MYKKVIKSIENKYGIKQVDSIDSDKPIVVALMPSVSLAREANGYLRCIMNFLRMRHNNDSNLGFDISDDLFNIYYDSKIDNIEDTLCKCFIPNNKDLCKKKIRTFNIFSYCSQNSEVSLLLDKLFNYLIGIGYSDEDTKEILSQLFVLQVVQSPGIDIKYCTNIIFHIIQDMENPVWKRHKEEFPVSNFSKIYNLDIDNIKKIILYDSFGEGSMSKCDREHNFKRDYALSPVLNSLISLCLFYGVNSSIKGENINLDYFSDGINYIIDCASKYEKMIGVDLDSLNKIQLNEFSEYIIKKLDDFLIKKYNIKVENERVKNLFIREVKLNNIYNKYEELFNLKENNVIKSLNEIIDYMKYDENEVINYVPKFDYCPNIQFPSTKRAVSDIVSELYFKFVKYINDLLEAYNNVVIPDDYDTDIKKDIEYFINCKKEFLNNIMNNEQLKDCLNKFNIENEFKIK